MKNKKEKDNKNKSNKNKNKNKKEKPAKTEKETPQKKHGPTSADVVGPLSPVEQEASSSVFSLPLRAKQIGLSVLALLFVGGAIFSIMRPHTVLSLLEPLGIEVSEPVATVNGEKIYRSDLNARVLQQKSTYEAQGADLSDPETKSKVESQILDVMISEELVLNKAKEQGITADSAKVEEEFEKSKENFASDEEFKKQLASYGLTEKTLRSNIANQIVIEEYLKGAVSEDAVGVTDEEVSAFYEQYSETQEDLEPLEELRPDIEKYLEQEKTNKEIARIVEELRADADVEILL